MLMTSRNLISRLPRNLTYCTRTKSTDVIFSGIQPTGIPHIGNYLGALKQWVQLQEEGHVMYCIVDLHAITKPHHPGLLRTNIRDMTTCLLAAGLDPHSSTIFQQSTVPQHTELAWILSCLTTLPQLSHQPQWRDKSEGVQNPGVGLYTYPILQSADILLYRATSVPVGEDQIKHIELTRHLARTFNNKYGEFFPEPAALLTDTKRIRSLRNPADKMSKSDQNVKSRIELTDTDETIQTKIQKSVTDNLGKLTYDPDSRPGVTNLIDIHSGLTGLTQQQICDQCGDMNMSAYKRHLADIVVTSIRPIREEYERLRSDEGFVDHVLYQGASVAQDIAQHNLTMVKKMVGFS